jgi:hypothetical protein
MKIYMQRLALAGKWPFPGNMNPADPPSLEAPASAASMEVKAAPPSPE